jgi:hypothetical protein
MDNFLPYYSPELTIPSYPFYHTGKDLEEYFIDFYFKNKILFNQTDYTFIPVKWVALFNHYRDLIPKLEQDIKKLDPTKKYFTVSQHDDAPYIQLPPKTVNFSAGGNIEDTIPIPLICSPLNYTIKEKDIFCSFVGSVPQNIGGFASLAYSLRMHMLEHLVNKNNYVLKPKHWSPDVNTERQNMFLDITARSKFTLCPRGYGATSFRLYEAMQLESVPVYIYYKQPFLPFKDEIDWSTFCILIDSENMSQIDNILTSITEETRINMIVAAKKIYSKYFTLPAVCDNICRIINKLN